MTHERVIRPRTRNTSASLAGCMLLMMFSSVKSQDTPTESQTQEQGGPVLSDLLVIQGRVTAIQGALVTVKTPDGYPGGRGGHAQFVTAGPTFRVDVSRARVLLPDGRQVDKVPLAVGDRVLAVLTGPNPGPSEPGNISQTYSASIVERVAQSDKIVTH